MNWLNPIALWGLTALAIPVLIHLWSKNKTKEIAFGSIRFLKESSTLRSRKIQLSEIPLLLLRLLILIAVVMLIAKWVSHQDIEKQQAILLGSEIKAPAVYSEEKLPSYRISEFGNFSNHWHLLEAFSRKHPETDSLIYINDFKDTDFVGAIPKLNFHLELISSSQSEISQERIYRDSLLIHFDKLPISAKEKFDKILEANHLYTSERVSFASSSKDSAQLIFTSFPQKLEANQIVLSDTLSVDYLIHIKPHNKILYLSEKWLQDPLKEDLVLLLVSEFIAQSVQPNYEYSTFDALYSRGFDAQNEGKLGQTFDQELLWLIAFLMMLERYFSFRKKHA